MKRLFALSLILAIPFMLALFSCTKEEEALHYLRVVDVGAGWVKLSGEVKDADTYSGLTFRFWMSKNPDDIFELPARFNKPIADDGKMTVEDYRLAPETTYYYGYMLRYKGGVYASDLLSFKTKDLPQGTMDMGMDVLWASHNLGASKPEEWGDSYAWGETSPKTEFSWDNYQWYKNGAITLYSSNSSSTGLELEEDAAHTVLGGKWRMPSMEEMNKLSEVCDVIGCEYRGVPGVVYTSPVTGNSIFFPSTVLTHYPDYDFYEGHYWLTDFDRDIYARGFKVQAGKRNPNGVSMDDYYHVYFDQYWFERYTAGAIRPVMDKE